MALPDAYTWRARIAPVLVVISPLLALATGAFLTNSGLAVGGGVAAIALLLFAAELSRDAGKALEPRLWRSWGGPPTTQKLRFRGASDRGSVARLHRQVEAATGVELPDAEAENADPDGADLLYADAVRDLRELTRDQGSFRLAFEENVSYGFRRNLLGVRPIGIVLAAATLAGSIAFVLAGSGDVADRIAPVSLASLCSLVVGLVLLRCVTDSWVRQAADRYAERLLGAAAVLSRRG